MKLLADAAVNAFSSIALFLIAGLCAVISLPVLLLLAPAIVLFFVLSLGCFPGEKVIEKVANWRGRRRGARLRTLELAPEPLDLVVKAGRQIAYALAVRPPPHCSVSSP